MCTNSTLLAAAAGPGAAQLVAAFQQGTLGVSLGIAGFLIGYLAGVVYMLAELGIINDSTQVAGASSGALLAMARCTGMGSEEFMGIVQQLSNECRRNNNCQGRLGDALMARVPGLLRPGVHKLCAGKAFFSVSTGSFDPPPRNLLVGDFSSDEDFIAAAHASSFIPTWSGPRTTTFRGQRAFDGVFSNAQPCPPGVTHCIRISSRNPPWNPKGMELYTAITRAASAGHFKPARLASLAVGSVRVQAAARRPVSQPVGPEALARAAALGVDIAPGLFGHPTGMSQDTWDELLVMPGDAELHRYLYELGQQDARTWAQLAGLAAAAACKKGSVPKQG